jgi:MarR family transcriptional regulator for hemolysin
LFNYGSLPWLNIIDPMAREVRDFGILLGLAYQGFVEELNAHLVSSGFAGVGASFGYVFRALLAESLTTSQLAARLRITPQGAAKIVDEMVAAGYVERRSDPADGRARRLRLTDRGRRAVATARRFHADYERRLADTHGVDRVAVLREVLTALVDRDPSVTETATRLLRPL